MTEENEKLSSARRNIDCIDKQTAYLFEERMKAVSQIAEYKIKTGLPVFDSKRENLIIEKNSSYISDSVLVPYYKEFLKSCIKVSRSYQNKLSDSCSKLTVNTSLGSYPVYFGCGISDSICRLFDFGENKVLIISDSGVPSEYIGKIKSLFNKSVVFIFEQGEENKSFQTFYDILVTLQKNKFGRDDYVLALGGGVVGDVAGYAASSYMRGIKFVNVPTTLLSQVDSSVGGKTAIDFCGIKNLVGSFYQPAAVFIDYSFLDSLPQKQISNGITECIKTAALFDKDLFDFLENNDFSDIRDKVIFRCVELKRSVVEADEHENGLRRVLNFGHTFAHAFEVAAENSALLHGEAVAIGMLPMCSASVCERIKALLLKNGLSLKFDGDINKAVSALYSDKKKFSDGISTVFLNDIGEYEFIDRTFCELENMIKGCAE